MDLVALVLPSLLEASLVTLRVTLQAGLLALVVSLVVGVLREVRNPLVAVPVRIYVEFFRGTSAFVQIYWVYFALPLIGVRLPPIEAGVIVLGLNVGAYGSEVVRGALEAIPRAQREACIALNLPPWTTFSRILLPQAMLRVVLPFGNLLIDLLKGTALLSAISVTELAFAGRQAASAFGQPLIIFSLVLVLYLCMAAPLAWAARAIDARVRRAIPVGMA
ncbi:MAG: ectoine/hydroxyectoine ABC transporter permease subunit EhuC [Azospirillaceae bacterium]